MLTVSVDGALTLVGITDTEPEDTLTVWAAIERNLVDGADIDSDTDTVWVEILRIAILILSSVSDEMLTVSVLGLRTASLNLAIAGDSDIDTVWVEMFLTAIFNLD